MLLFVNNKNSFQKIKINFIENFLVYKTIKII